MSNELIEVNMWWREKWEEAQFVVWFSFNY